MSDRGARRIHAGLGIGYGVLWIALAVAPKYRADWLLENLLVFATVPALVLTYRRFPFSTLAYALMAAFLALHQVGAHYTYSEVPLGFWAKERWGLSRNHYDRVVHFAFGLLMSQPTLELIARTTRARRWLGILAFSAVFAMSAVFEILEWWVAALTHPELGTAYLGTQGDVWDAQKDSSLAALGSVLYLLATRPWLPVSR